MTIFFEILGEKNELTLWFLKRQRNENILGVLEFFVVRMVTMIGYFFMLFWETQEYNLIFFFKILKTWNSMMQDNKQGWPVSPVSAHEMLLLSWNSCFFIVTSHLELLVNTRVFFDDKDLIIIIFFWMHYSVSTKCRRCPLFITRCYSPHNFNWHCRDGFWEHQYWLWWFLLAASHSLHLYLLEAVACLEKLQPIIGKWKSFCNILVSHWEHY